MLEPPQPAQLQPLPTQLGTSSPSKSSIDICEPMEVSNSLGGTTIEEPPPAYSTHYLSDIGSSAPVRFIGSLINDDDSIEHVEHFKYKQDLDRKLTVTSVIGLGFSVMGVPFGLSSTLWISLMDGANVTLLYGWLLVGFFSICVVLSLCEIISKYPTAGGVYHFSALLSNEKYSSISSWFTGWFLLIGNWTYAISIMFAGSQFILSVFGLKDLVYNEDSFLVLAVFFLILLFSGFINFYLARYLEQINRVCIYWTIYTVLAIDFLLIFYARRTNSIKDILTTFDNSRSGWPDPIAFMVGLQSSSFTLTGYGMLFSMTDEVKNPERNMPKGALSAVLMATVTGIIFIIPILTILPELKLLLDETPNIMPIDLVFKLATESYIVSFLMACLMIGTVIFQSIGSLTTASRSTYALARDGALPMSHLFTTVNSIEAYTIPRNALFLSMAVCAVISLLSLMSQSAFNAFMGAAVISLTIANGIPILCLMLNKRRKIKGAAFRLRRIGWIINGLAVFWVFLCSIILCFPPVIKNLTWRKMNYALLVMFLFTGISALGFITWGKKSFTGPSIDEDYFDINNMEMARIDTSKFVIADEDDLEDNKMLEEDIVENKLKEMNSKTKKKRGNKKYLALEGNSHKVDSDSDTIDVRFRNSFSNDTSDEQTLFDEQIKP